MSVHGVSSAPLYADFSTLLQQAERALRRLAFVDLRLTQLETDFEALIQADRSPVDGTTGEVISLLRQIAQRQEEAQRSHHESLQEMSSRVEQLLELISKRLEELAPVLRPTGGLDAHDGAALGVTSWDAAKRRLLADWQAEPQEEVSSCTGPQQEHPQEDNAPATADWQAQLAAKDQEIAALRAELAEWSERKRVLDDNELIRQERERLLELQRMWEAKLRQAEVEISIERAKLARERSELEERVRTLSAAQNPPNGADSNGPLRRSRWLTQLGLSD